MFLNQLYKGFTLPVDMNEQKKTDPSDFQIMIFKEL